ncbi:MAG: type VI secretion system protein TssA [Spirochaetaceae bacterium]|jgi:type VI secretion system ImpA family protein|nr:type VI secretion system protein TssA [Spirochaetaceae bacterium]
MQIEEMAAPLAGENPAGENLEYDTAYMELEALASGAPGTQIGEASTAAQEPDWRKLNENCLELWKKTRDLRVASYLLVSETVLRGLQGFIPAFKLLIFLVSDMWESFYPRLDPEYDNSPVERINILAMLSPDSGAINDPVMFLSHLRETRLVPSLHYTLRDLMIASGEIEVSGEKAFDANLLRAEMMNVPITEIQEALALAREGKELIAALCEAMNGKMEDGSILTLNSLSREVNRLLGFYDNQLKSFGPTAGGATASADGQGADDSVAPEGGLQNISAGSIMAYQARTRADALLLLKKGAEYFQRQEPNSPIPLLVNRALRFSDMNFLDLIEDMMPDALSRGRDILGIKPEEQQNGGQ